MKRGLLHPEQFRSFRKKSLFLSLLAERLLHEGIDKGIARAILNDDPLFENDRKMALSFFERSLSEMHSDDELAISTIDEVYRYLGGEPSEDVHFQIILLLERQIATEKQSFDLFLSEQTQTLNAKKSQINELKRALSARNRLAVLALATVMAGVFAIFIGFGQQQWVSVGFGVFLLFPAVLITDVPGSLVQFRKDKPKHKEMVQLVSEIEFINALILKKKSALTSLQTRLSKESSS